jgi:hypothetical protein
MGATRDGLVINGGSNRKRYECSAGYGYRADFRAVLAFLAGALAVAFTVDFLAAGAFAVVVFLTAGAFAVVVFLAAGAAFEADTFLAAGAFVADTFLAGVFAVVDFVAADALAVVF